jgi:hypothetical protein
VKDKRVPLHLISNPRGIISADFIFALILCVGLCVVLFSLNFTLSMAEVAQYIAFSAARAHASGHIDQDKQKVMGTNKYQELINNPVLKPLFNSPNGGWFKLVGFEIKGGGASDGGFFDDYPKSETRVPQVGVRFKFIPTLLSRKIPFLGSTSEDGTENSFSANVTGLLIREPSMKECKDQVSARYKNILDLDERYKQLGAASQDKYFPLEDNGC